MGRFVVFEGIDKSGKTTQIEMIYKYLKDKYGNVILIKEPGTTELGEELRQLLLNKSIKISPISELFLYLAARAQLIEEYIKNYKNEDIIILSDRYYYSTIAYQGYGRGLDVDMLLYLNKIVVNDYEPDYIFFFDIDNNTFIKRKGDKIDRIEKERIEFFEKVKEGYYFIFKSKKNVFYIDATKSKDEIFNEILKIFESKILGREERK